MRLELIEKVPGTIRYNHYIFRNIKGLTYILNQLTIFTSKQSLCEYESVNSITSEVIESKLLSATNNSQFNMDLLEVINCDNNN